MNTAGFPAYQQANYQAPPPYSFSGHYQVNSQGQDLPLGSGCPDLSRLKMGENYEMSPQPLTGHHSEIVGQPQEIQIVAANAQAPYYHNFPQSQQFPGYLDLENQQINNTRPQCYNRDIYANSNPDQKSNSGNPGQMIQTSAIGEIYHSHSFHNLQSQPGTYTMAMSGIPPQRAASVPDLIHSSAHFKVLISSFHFWQNVYRYFLLSVLTCYLYFQAYGS